MLENIRSMIGLLDDKTALRTYIGSVPLQWSELKTDSKGATLKTHRLENKEGSLISSNTELDNRKVSFSCKMNHEVKNRNELFKELETYRDKKMIINVTGVVQYQDMQILSISKSINNIEMMEFDIDLEQVTFARLKTTGEVSEEEQTQLQQQQQTGVQGTSTSIHTPDEVVIL